MNRKRGQLQAYFAGIIDGEGCIQVRGKAGNTYTAGVSVQMDNPEAIMLLWREYPEATLRKCNREVGRPYYVFALNHYKAYRFLQDIEPFLILKRAQARITLAFLAHRRRNHSRTKGFDCKGRCERFHLKCKAMKRPDPQGVNSVNALLDHGLREYRAKRAEVEEDVRILVSKLEGVETMLMSPTDYKAMSAPEKEIVQFT